MKVSDLLEFFSTNSLSWEQLEFEGTGLLNLHYGLIHNGLPNQIDINNSSLPVVKAGFEPRKFTLCKTGDIAFADASEDTDDVGKVVEFVDCAGKDVVCGLHTIHGRDKLDKTVPGFKGYAFSSKVFHDQIKRIAQGTKVFSIRASNFDEVYIGIPRMEEQRKIATLLSLIDLRISVQNKVIEDLKKLKTALEERLLNQCIGEQVRLGDILTERVEKSRINNQYEVLSSTVSGIYSQREFFNKEIASADNTGYKVIHRDDVVLSPQNLWMGNINFNDCFEIGIVSPSYKVFSINAKYDKRYIAFLLKTRKTLWEFSLVSEQGASVVRRNLNIESFLEIAFHIPTMRQQIESGNMISSVFEKIRIEQRYLKTLIRQKHCLLNNLII